jgi:hypothetical protein
MDSIGTISEIWRYPAKSMGGERLPSANITPGAGLDGDRRWALRDEEMAEIVNGRRVPKIMLLSARFSGGTDPSGEREIEVTLPTGEKILSGDPYAHAALSAYLGRRVTLWPVRPKSDTKHYSYGHMVTPKDLRKILGRPPHGPLADPSRLRFPDLLEVIRFSVQRGTYFDLNRLHIVTTASLRRLQEMLPRSRIDVRRFRPNLVIDTGSSVEPFAEHGWAGWELHVGDVRIAIRAPAIRCTMPGQEQPGLEADQNVQIAIRRELNEDFGVYADPLAGGGVKIGDEVRLVPPKSRVLNSIVRKANTALIKAMGAPNALIDKLEQKPRPAPKNTKPPKEFRQLTLTEKRMEGTGATSLVLTADAPAPWPTFLPGQHLLFRLDIPGQARPVYRSYSLSSSPRDTGRYRITVKRESAPASGIPAGISSNHLLDHAKVGDRLWVRGPMGRFHLNPNSARPAVFLSTGIGITPLMSMANAIAEVRPKREVIWFHGVRNEAEFALAEELRALRGKMPGLRLFVRHSQPVTNPSGEGEDRGRVDFAFARGKLPHLDFDFHLCGNRAFMEQIHSALRKAGVAGERIHHEFFGQGDSLEPADLAAHPFAAPIRVGFARSGRELIWERDAVSLLDFAERNGVPIDFGCRYGNCHACKVKLISGQVRHFALADPPPGENVILSCSSVPLEDVILDA